MNGNGHLSNEQAHGAISRLAETAIPSAIVLLHLSRDCNHPDLLQRFWASRSPHLADRVHITNQTIPSERIEVRAAELACGEPANHATPTEQTLWH